MIETRRKPVHVAKKKLRCFISAPFDCNTEPISEALAEAGVKPFSIDEIIPDRTVVDTISDGIVNSDFACAFSREILLNDDIFRGERGNRRARAHARHG